MGETIMGQKLENKAEKRGPLAWFQSNWKQHPLFSTGVVLILMIIIQTGVMVANSSGGTFGELCLSLLTNWINILKNNASVGIIALGMTFVIISGGIDLSVGSTLVAIGAVVMNRLRSGRYGSTIADVIYAPGQFGVVSNGSILRYTGGPKASCVQAAQEAINGYTNIGGFTRFKNARSSVSSDHIVIGNHVFY